ncbi:MAG: SRPBCC family protein, partial [Granulosicoccus sp.]|nr:SRPBCC family protein [Granulosicoccus sp.]
MPSHEVTSSTHIAEPADLVWSKLRDFHGLWHPSIDTMAVEHDDKGGLLRAFTVKNEKTLYREKLTWFSDSERSMAYTHVQGIAGVEHYDARLELTATDRDDVLIRLSAHLEASEPRATQIAMGTQSIFDSAIASIESLD